jgi:Asp/Glu/hydantoin racemase
MSASTEALPPPRLLLVNPNTTSSMTDALHPAIDSLHLPVSVAYFTCPEPGIPSINSPDDSKESAKICLPHVVPLLPHHDLFLVACYSHHPLVPWLKSESSALAAAATESGSGARKYVTGIFEASVLASLSLLPENQRFGIVSTGKSWEAGLTEAVHAFLGAGEIKRYAGTETTGLNATELHDLPAGEVKQKMKEATKRLLQRGNVGAICLGCAGMVGLDETVREACVEELGNEAGKEIHIIDGVKAGVAQLVGNSRLAH